MNLLTFNLAPKYCLNWILRISRIHFGAKILYIMWFCGFQDIKMLPIFGTLGTPWVLLMGTVPMQNHLNSLNKSKITQRLCGDKCLKAFLGSCLKQFKVWLNLILFDPIWSNSILFDPILLGLIQFDQVWSNLIKYDPI